jgi:hypothetical protein
MLRGAKQKWYDRANITYLACAYLYYFYYSFLEPERMIQTRVPNVYHLLLGDFHVATHLVSRDTIRLFFQRCFHLK